MFDICIPYKTGNLGEAYNEAMENAKSEWVLLLDHDVLILRPNWHDMCVRAIETAGKKAGWISAVTNSCWCDDQRTRIDSDLIPDHIIRSNMLYEEYQFRLREPKPARKPLGNVFSGYFILTHKDAWSSVGGFETQDRMVNHFVQSHPIQFHCNKFLGVDNDYCLKLRAAGYQTLTMPGLYVYHLRERKREIIT